MFNVKVGMKCNINLLVSVLLVTYFFYCNNCFQNLYSTQKTQWKHGGFHNETLKRI